MGVPDTPFTLGKGTSQTVRLPTPPVLAHYVGYSQRWKQKEGLDIENFPEEVLDPHGDIKIVFTSTKNLSSIKICEFLR